METIPETLEVYLDGIKTKDPTNITEAEVDEYLKICTESIEGFCQMINHVDVWERSSNGFMAATALHIACNERSKTGDELAKQYRAFYDRTCDPEDYAGKLIQDAVDERYGK